MADQALAIGELNHKVSKGRLREIFARSILDRFLTSQFGVGSGIIVNQRGDQSFEQDVIIFDRRILPPFLQLDGLGIFPIEAVVATIEIKSILGNAELEKSEQNAQRLHDMTTHGSIYQDGSAPAVAILGFRTGSLTCKNDTAEARQWLQSKLHYIWAVGVVGEICWLRLRDWEARVGDTDFEETKRFLSVFFDNLRTGAERRYQSIAGNHHDWLSVYTRWDCSGSEVLRGNCVDVITSTTTSTTTSSPPPSSLAEVSSTTPEPDDDCETSGCIWGLLPKSICEGRENDC